MAIKGVEHLDQLDICLTSHSPTVVVGDMACRSFFEEYGFRPRITIIDGHTGDKNYGLPYGCNTEDITHRVFCDGRTVSYDLNEAVYDALEHISGKHSLIWVTGEEDIAPFLVKLYAEDGTLLYYGDPVSQCIKVCRCDRESRFEGAERLFRRDVE